MLPKIKRISVKYHINYFSKQQLVLRLFMEKEESFKSFARTLLNVEEHIKEGSPYFLFAKEYMLKVVFNKIKSILKDKGNVFYTENEFIIEFFTDDGYDFLDNNNYKIVKEEIKEYIKLFFGITDGIHCNFGGYWNYAFEVNKQYLNYFNEESSIDNFYSN